MSGTDAAVLFGGAAAQASGDAPAPGEVAAKRRKLKDTDSVANVLFRPWEASPLEGLSPKELFEAAAEGNKYVAYHTELADAADEYRVGVGISRNVGVLVKFIERLEGDQTLKRLLDAKVLDRVLAEAGALKEHVKVLDFGKGSQRQDGGSKTLYSLRKQPEVDAAPAPDEAAVKAAVGKLLEWLRKEVSPLRSLMQVLAAGGLPFAALAAEKTLRGWASQCNTAAAESAALKRAAAAGKPVPKTTDNAAAAGLFEDA